MKPYLSFAGQTDCVHAPSTHLYYRVWDVNKASAHSLHHVWAKAKLTNIPLTACQDDTFCFAMGTVADYNL